MNIFEYCNRFPLVKIPDNTILYGDLDKIKVKNVVIYNRHIGIDVRAQVHISDTSFYECCYINYCRIPPKTAISLLGKVL